MNEGLPAAGSFDHVLVRASIGGKTYWLDGTRPRDRSLESIPVPDFHWALPLRLSGAVLEPLLPKPFDEPHLDMRVRLDARQGPDKPVSAHVELTYRDDAATAVRLQMKQTAAAEVDRSLRQYWTRQYPWITADKVAFIDDEARASRRSVWTVPAFCRGRSQEPIGNMASTRASWVQMKVSIASLAHSAMRPTPSPIPTTAGRRLSCCFRGTARATS